MSFDGSLLPDLLPVYYNRFFPTKIFCRWLSCGCSPQPLSNRELSVTLADDVYIRYQSISNPKDLVTLFQKKCPFKIDIGAVYNTKPAMAKQDAVVIARELVFDIDLTDYDEVRTCCQGADVCDKCWKFMVVACQILDAALKDDFAFSSVLWVYSGRRGVHCWVSSAEARCLTSAGRTALADYLSVIVGGDMQSKKVHFLSDNIHSSVKRAHKIVSTHFESILSDQQFISTPEGLAKFVKLIPDETLSANIQKCLSDLPPDSAVRWATFVQLYKTYLNEHSSNRKLKHLVEEIQLQWCYPRLDINVTKGSNHLLKAPFSIHPKTGKVCVVFRPSQVASLKPHSVPNLDDLLDDQLPNHQRAKTLMQDSVSAFQDHVWALEKEEAKRRRANAEESIEF